MSNNVKRTLNVAWMWMPSLRIPFLEAFPSSLTSVAAMCLFFESERPMEGVSWELFQVVTSIDGGDLGNSSQILALTQIKANVGP